RRIAKGMILKSPAGKPGDILWVRETWMDLTGTGIDGDAVFRRRYAYGAECLPGSFSDEARKDFGLKWKPSIHMPRTACRLRLEVADVRLERLQDISAEEARAEGCPTVSQKDPVGWYRSLWQSIHGQASWDADPSVWVIHFEVMR
ncbi:ASCH domain-containing protein, partial [Acidithiobacillus sp.]